MNKKCLLCQQKEASSIKSHFVPKFIGKDLKDNNKMLVLGKDNMYTFYSDLPKREGFFCVVCEGRFNVVETISKRILDELRDNNYERFSVLYDQPNGKIIKMKNDVEIFNLFLLSIIWRVSISTEMIYKNINLPRVIEEKIRTLLDYNLKSKKEEYKYFDKFYSYKIFNLFFKIPYLQNSKEYKNMSFIDNNGIYIFNFPFFQLTLIERKALNKSVKGYEKFNHNLSSLHINIVNDQEFFSESLSSLSKFRFTEEKFKTIISKSSK